MPVDSSVRIFETFGKVEIDQSAIVMPYTVIFGPVKIGPLTYIGPHCVIGDVPEIKNWCGQPKPLMIGRANSIREFTIITAGATHETIIEDFCYIFKGTKISHDCHIESDVILCGANIAGSCRIMHHANLGMNVTVHQGRKIGSYAMVGMGAAVTRDLPPFSLAYGIPAKLKGYNRKYLKERELYLDKEMAAYEKD